jgi:hypothetical protein
MLAGVGSHELEVVGVSCAIVSTDLPSLPLYYYSNYLIPTILHHCFYSFFFSYAYKVFDEKTGQLQGKSNICNLLQGQALQVYIYILGRKARLAARLPAYGGQVNINKHSE